MRVHFRTAIDIPLALFLSGAILGLFPGYEPSTAWLPLAVLLGGVILYLLASRLAGREPLALQIAIIVALLTGLVSLYFITQYGHYPSPDKIETVSRLARGISRFFPDLTFWTPVPNSIATLLEGLLFLNIGTALTVQARVWKIILAACAVLAAMALLLSESRGAWLAVAGAGLLWLSLYFRPMRILAILAGLVLLALVILVVARRDMMVLGQIPLVDRTLAPLFIRPDRLKVYQGSLALIRSVPLTGIGLGQQFAMNYSRYALLIQVPFLYYSHNLYLEIWLEQGLLGIAAFVWLVVALYFGARQRQYIGHNRLFESTWIGLTAVLLHGVTDARQYSDLWTWLPFFLLLGLFVALQSHRALTHSTRLLVIPAAGMAAFLLLVTVTLPALPAAWRVNLGSLQQARADLSTTLTNNQRSTLLSQAEANFRRALVLDPSEGSAHLRLGLILLDREEFKAAIEQLEPAFADYPSLRAARKALGLAYLWSGQVERARDLLAPVPQMTEELNNWGIWRSQQSQPGLAR